MVVSSSVIAMMLSAPRPSIPVPGGRVQARLTTIDSCLRDREYAATYRNTYHSAFDFYEYRARPYHPFLGRFMSEDPKGFAAGDVNLFRYVGNDPVNRVDPMGLQEAPENAVGGSLMPGSVWRMTIEKEETNAERLSRNAMHFSSGTLDNT